MNSKTTATLTNIVRLGLDEKRVRIRQAQADMVRRAVDGSYRAAGLYGQQLEGARREFGRLLKVEGQQAKERQAPRRGAAEP